VVGALLDRQVSVRAATTTPERMPALEGRWQPVRLDFQDPRTFGPAVRGCGAVFLMRPPAIAEVSSTLNAFVDVAAREGVRHVVFLSVAGAGENRIVPHHAVEQHLLRGAMPWTVLRPGFFAQNFGDAYRRDIVEQDRVYVPAGEGVVAFVDARDIAEVAAVVLGRAEEHVGKAYTLTGPESIGFHGAARLLETAVGRPIRYVPASILGYVAHLLRRRMPVAQVAVQTVLHVGLRFGQAARVDDTMTRLLGRRGRVLADYIRDHAYLWSAKTLDGRRADS